MILVYLLIFAVILYCSESKQIKRYLQKGGVEPAVAVGGIIVFAVVVGLLIWFLTRDKSSPTPAPTTKPSHRRHHHGHVGSPPSDTPPHGGITPPVDNTLVSPFSSPCSFKSPGPGTTNLGILNQQCSAEGSQKDSHYVFTGTTCSQPCYTALVSARQCSHLDSIPGLESILQNNISHCKTVSPHLKEPPNVIKPKGVTPPSSKTATFVSDDDLRKKASKIPDANKRIPKPTVDAATQKECAKYFADHGDFCKGAMDRQKNMKRSGGICTKQCLDFLTQVHKFFATPSEKCHNFVISNLVNTRGLLEFYTRKSEQDVKICKSLPVNSDGLQK